MPLPLLHSPADVVRRRMILDGVAGAPAAVPVTATTGWPAYTDSMPDVPDRAVSVHDTQGRDAGRIHPDGSRAEFFGVMVRVRAESFPAGWGKARAVAEWMDAVLSAAVTAPDGTAYVVHSVNRTGDVNVLGPGPDGRRFLFTVNATCVVRRAAVG